MTELPLTEQDEIDLARLTEEAPTPVSLLRIWSEVLSNIEGDMDNPIPIQVSAKVIRSWPFLSVQDTAQYHLLYHAMLLELRGVLSERINENLDALTWVGVDDGDMNHTIYRDILVGWHLLLDAEEQNWFASDDDAHIRMAVIADARAFFFSSVGLAGHLDSIGFTMADGEFVEALNAAVEERGE